MVNLRLMEDRLERYDRKIVELNDELMDIDYGDRTASDVKADIKYYEKLLTQAVKISLIFLMILFY